MTYPTKKLGAKRWRQQKGKSAEMNFETFCNRNEIFCERIEDMPATRKKVLQNSEGKCPDFLCTKNENKIFVEVKNHTLLTNEARNKAMVQTIQAKKAAGLSGTTIFDSFDPVPELKVPFEGYLRDVSKKFKNIKTEFNFQRILLLDGIQILEHDICNIFLGALLDVDRGEYIKNHTGLLDLTGSNVSAIAYWDVNSNRYKGIANPRAKIILLEEDFRLFFETTNV